MGGHKLIKFFIILSIIVGALTIQGCTHSTFSDQPGTNNDVGNLTDVDQDGMTTEDGDCDDNNATIYAGATELDDDLDNDCNGIIDEGIGKTIDLFSDVLGCEENDYQGWLVVNSSDDTNIQIYLRKPDTEDLDGDGNTSEDTYFYLNANWTIAVGDEAEYLDRKTLGIDLYFTNYISNANDPSQGHNALKIAHDDGYPTNLNFAWVSATKPDYLTQDFWTTYYNTVPTYQVNPSFGTCYPNTENEVESVLYVVYPSTEVQTALEELVTNYTDTFFKFTNGWYYDRNNYQKLLVRKASSTEGLATLYNALTEAN
jgi:hypothetical protein